MIPDVNIEAPGSRSNKVLVVGNGVIGLTTALELRDLGFQVVVVSSDREQWHADASAADLASLEWASGIAGGIWLPFHIEPMDRVRKWGLATLQRYHAQMSGTGPNSLSYKDHVELVPVVQLFVSESAKPAPEWATGELSKYHGFQRLSASEIEAKLADYKFKMPSGYQSAWLMYSTVCDSVAYLAALENELISKQVEIRYGVHLQGHAEVCTYAKYENCSCVVNCAGLGAGALSENACVVTPARGILSAYRRPSDNGEYKPEQSVMVLAEEGHLPAADNNEACTLTPEMPGYVIPRGSLVVTGGSYLEHDRNRTVSKEEKARLRCIARHFMPALEDPQGGISEVFSVAGLRPVSIGGVRCDVSCKPDGLLWADNFGHGGAGWVVAWGCAKEIAETIREHLSRNISKL